MKKIVFLLFTALYATLLSAQSGDNIAWSGYPNGMIILLSHQEGSMVYTDFYLRAGHIYENKNEAGSSQMIAEIIRQNCERKVAKLANGKVSVDVLPENIIFRFVSAVSDFEKIMDIFRQDILHTTFTAAETEQLCNRLMQQRKTAQQQEDSAVTAYYQLYQSLFSDYASRITNNQYPVDYCSLDSATLDTYHKKYFMPAHFTITVMGNIEKPTIEKNVILNIDSMHRGMYSYELINKIKDIKPVRYSTQHYAASAKLMSEMQLIYQNPSGRKDRKGAYCGFLLSRLLSNPSPAISRYMQQFPLLSGCYATYETQINYALFTLSARDSSSHFNALSDEMLRMINGLATGKIITSADLAYAQKYFAVSFNSFRADSKNYLAAIAKYRFPYDNFFISSLADSVATVSVEDMNRYLKKYFTDVSPVYFLKADTAAIHRSAPAEKWLSLDTAIAETRFFYEKNIYQLSSSDSSVASRIYRWMKINPDLQIIVNGFSDISEYEKVKDTTLLQYVDSTPNFRKVMPDFIFKKRYFKPELARSLAVVKYLTDMGIDKSRVSGTGMRLRYTNEDAPEKNRYVSFYFYKVRPKVQELRNSK